jgi:hypothetical protein
MRRESNDAAAVPAWTNKRDDVSSMCGCRLENELQPAAGENPAHGLAIAPVSQPRRFYRARQKIP